MLRRQYFFYLSRQVLRDTMLAGLAFALAYSLRFAFPNIFPFGSISPPRETIWVGMVLLMVWPLVGWFEGLYRKVKHRAFFHEALNIIRVILLVFFVLVTLTYFLREERFSRGMIL